MKIYFVNILSLDLSVIRYDFRKGGNAVGL
nr:MAG TPA: hypothetical protein [Microviridae sp.]